VKKRGGDWNTGLSRFLLIIMATQFQLKWVKRRSEFEGFSGVLYCTDAKGEYIRIDYSLKDKKARLTVEDRTERRYHSLIISSSIEKEWVARSAGGAVASVMKRKAHIFSMIPDQRIVSLIRGCYGIGTMQLKRLKTGKKKKNGSSLVVIIVIGILIIITVILSYFT
jgi:hypothetical protein